jgi:2-octaprenyl-6-methoxyphenol hydroxylase
MSDDFDVTIIGGGMVGASLALALAPLELRVALIESVPYDAAAQPSFDERTTALSNGSRRILETMGVWPDVAAVATAIRKIHVSDRGRFGFARVDAAEQGLAAMGFVLPNRALGAALWTRIDAVKSIRVFCPAEVGAIDPVLDDAHVGVQVQGARDPVVRSIRTRLVVAADGVHSCVRSAFGVESASRDYGQTAVITTILPQRFHDHVAYERFTESGPLALLPLADGRCTLVLTLNHSLVDAALGWTDAEFLAEVQQRFGFRLGRFLKVGRRSAYPLSLTQSARTSAGRCAIVGNAAQGLHPVAGMGFNLGLRDVACLAETLAESSTEPGEPRGLARYDEWRARDRRAVIGFTDGLVRMFSHPGSLVRGVRNLGLLAFDAFPPAKSALSRLSTGADGRIPKLARGVALTRAVSQ